MKATIVALIIGVLVLTSFKEKKDDPEILRKILRDYFDGLKAKDLNKLNSLTTKDFILFENGKIFTNDSLVRVKKFKSEGNWTLSQMKVYIDESSGDVIYFNHGDFVINDTIKRRFDWLESATFRKVNGRWKMNFLHSTTRK